MGVAISVGALSAILVLLMIVISLPMLRRVRPDVARGVLHQEMCSIAIPLRLGFIAGANMPIARVLVYPDELAIVTLKTFHIPYDSIEAIDTARRWFSKAVRLTLINMSVKEIWLYSSHPERLAKIISSQRDAAQKTKE